jgi:hypothetical protein
MRGENQMMLRMVYCIGISLFFLTGCSLAADVTPPPGMARLSTETPQVDGITESQVTPELKKQIESSDSPTDASRDPAEEPASIITDTLGIELLEPTGVISGTVTNASGGEIPAGIDILLHGFDDMEMVLTDTVKLAEDGIFVFDQIPLKPGRAFVTSMDFEGISYASNVAVAGEGMNSLQLPMEIFESTSDSTGLMIDRLHVFFETIDEKTIRVIELYVISNSGNKAVVSPTDGDPVLNIALPSNAVNLEFREGELGMRFVQTQDGFGDLAVIRPGMASHQIVFKYELPFDRKLAFGHPVYLPVNAVVVLVPEDSLKVKGNTLQDAGTRTTDGFTYRTYNGSELAGGAQLQMDVSQQSTFSKPMLSSGSSSGVVLGMVVLFLTLSGVGVWLYRRSQNPELTEAQERAKPVPAVEDTQDSLMDAILALDDQYKAGNLPGDAYRKRRTELKERLSKLLQ